MLKRFCDHCEAEIDGQDFQHLHIVASPDENGDGTISAEWDMCPDCADELYRFLDGERAAAKSDAHVPAETGRPDD